MATTTIQKEEKPSGFAKYMPILALAPRATTANG